MVVTATAAAVAASDNDTTLDFDPAVLKDLFQNKAPYIVGVPFSPGVIVSSTNKHDLVAVPTELIENCIPQTVMYYSNNTEAVVDAVAELSPEVTVLFARRKGEPLPPLESSRLDRHDGVSEKVVTFFPYMDTVAMFKGHVVLKHAISRKIKGAPEEDFMPWSVRTFSFTCPYASSITIGSGEEAVANLMKTHLMTLGAPVFNLSGSILGLLNDVGTDYTVKFARGSADLSELLGGLRGDSVNWLKGEEIVRYAW